MAREYTRGSGERKKKCNQKDDHGGRSDNQSDIKRVSFSYNSGNRGRTGATMTTVKKTRGGNGR